MPYHISRTRCEVCGTYLGAAQAHGGSGRRYCSPACKQRAYRDRRSIPPDLKNLHRWARADGKRPIQPSGLPASTTDPGTWSDYRHVQSGAGDGMGIMLGDGLACYDLDHCLGTDRLPGLLERIMEPVIWSEISMSGDGLHVFVRSTAPSYKRGGVEYYSHGRFIRMTGRRYRI